MLIASAALNSSPFLTLGPMLYHLHLEQTVTVLCCAQFALKIKRGATSGAEYDLRKAIFLRNVNYSATEKQYVRSIIIHPVEA